MNLLPVCVRRHGDRCLVDFGQVLSRRIEIVIFGIEKVGNQERLGTNCVMLLDIGATTLRDAHIPL